eukprot:jgi/Chrpa1/16947/Chrysochromulina_OHIO_Genome00020552-RA
MKALSSMSMLAGDCSYGAADGGGRLCVPRFCEPPPAIKAAPWAQMNANYLNELAEVRDLNELAAESG